MQIISSPLLTIKAFLLLLLIRIFYCIQFKRFRVVFAFQFFPLEKVNKINGNFEI